VNVLYFSLAAVLMGRLQSRLVVAGASLGALAVIVVLGEIMPKTLALARAPAFARTTAMPLSLCRVLFRPARALFGLFIRRVLFRMAHAEGGYRRLKAGELADFLRTRPDRFGFDRRTSRLLQAVMELEELKVREVMIPRVDVPGFDMDRGIEALRRHLRESQLPWILLYKDEPDRAMGLVETRDILLPLGGRSLIERMRQLPVIPEVAPLAGALATFLRSGSDFGLVVDEYGGMAGLLSIRKLAEVVVGELSEELDPRHRPLVSLGRGRWRLAGTLPIRNWRDRFLPRGAPDPPGEVETLGGLVAYLLGRIPREGDRCAWGDFSFRVLRVRKRRVEAVEMSGTAGPGEGEG